MTLFEKFEKWSVIALLWLSMLICVFLGATMIYSCTANASTIDCSKHSIYCQIIKNKPSINKKYAMRLSNVIYNKTKQHNIDPVIFTAIIAQESMYKLSAKNCIRGLTTKLRMVKDKNGITDLDKTGEVLVEARVCTDFGLTQIHYGNVKKSKLDAQKLTTDLEYSVDEGAKVLKHFKRYKKKEKDWWTRYNSPTRSNREIYKKLVERFL